MYVGNTVLSGTTETQIGAAALSIPKWAKMIVGVEVACVPDALTTGEPVLATAAVKSNDLSLTPFEVLPAPMSAGLTSSISGFLGKPEKYAMNVPCQGGEEVSVYQTGGFDHTAEPYASAHLMVANQEWVARFGKGLRQRHAKVGTVTSTATTASTLVKGTKYNFSGAEHIVELYGTAVLGTVAAGDGLTGYIEYQSSEFDGVSAVQLPLNPIPACLGSYNIVSNVDGVSRMPVHIPLFGGQINIQDYAFFGLIPAAAGRFVDGVIYE